MIARRLSASAALLALLSSCGGGGGGTSGAVAGGATSATPTPTASDPCSLRARQDWALAQLQEWYLFPDLLVQNADPAAYSTVDDYIDALTATARAQNKDRYFTYLTSIKAEDAYYDAGASAGFGIRLSYDSANRRLFVTEAFENTPALAAGIDRGTEITAIGTTTADLVSVSDLFARDGAYAVSDALGPSTAGTTRVLRLVDATGATREVSVTKQSYELLPVSTRYGAKVIDDNGTKIGYVNLRTFISTADQPLRDAMASFRSAGIDRVVIDLRYNGGGLVSTANLLTNLLGRNRSSSEVLSYVTFRPSKSSRNETNFFAPPPQSIAPVKLAFIGTGGTASASELVINAMLPYLGANEALVGANTYGKPVGQIPLDRSACDDRLRVVAFATQNANRQGDYYNGLASKMQATCQATDDLSKPFGDPQEASLRQAINFLEGQSCTPINASATAALREDAATGGSARLKRELLSPERPSTAQREVPGLY